MTTPSSPPACSGQDNLIRRSLRMLAALWGVSGIVFMLGYAVLRLSAYASMALSHGLDLLQWALLLLNVIFMAYSEGYKGFQQAFSPRVAARAYYLAQHAGWVNGLLAPLFCFGFFGTTRRRQVIAISMSLMIVVFVLVVREIPQPWRGIIDAGVVTGICWGILSLFYFVWQAFVLRDCRHDPEIK